MPGLHPLQNAQPKHQIPNEAPKYFNPFFEQLAKPAPVTIWQPPHMEKPLRSKAPTHRPRSPPTIPTAGTWIKPVVTEPKGQKGLFQHRVKRSIDEMMWLGSVTGFEVKVEPSRRSKLVRKPEMIPSQASAATGPRATEAQKKKEESEKARERRLEEWANKKKPQIVMDKAAKTASSAVSPQPIESRLRPRKKIYTPVPQVAHKRPTAIHRPHMPSQESSTYAPDRRVLPQPIESVARSTRTGKNKTIADKEEGMLWIGKVQPEEPVRHWTSKKTSPLKKVSGVDDDAHSEEQKPNPIKAEILPQPMESSVRSTRSRPTRISALAETTSTRASTRNPASPHLLPEPIETTRKSNRPGKIALPKCTQSTEPFNGAAISEESEGSSSLAGATKGSCRPDPVPIQAPWPPTPTTSFFGPDILPQPIESTRRSHRPLGRPLIPQPIETSNRTTRVRPQEPELQLELPQPVSVSRWNSSRSVTRATLGKDSARPMSPGLYAPPLNRNRSRRQLVKDHNPAADHVLHLHEPVDSAPSSPLCSPEVSRCPSLSSSSSSATSMLWEIPSQGIKKRGGFVNHRESQEGALADYMLGLKQKLEKADALGTTGRLRERAKEESEYPFPIVVGTDSGIVDDIVLNQAPDWSLPRRTSSGSETIRPQLRTVVTAPTTPPASDASSSDHPSYEICKSPVFAAFKRPTATFDDLDMEDLDLENTQLPTPPNSMPNGGPGSAPPRLHYCQAGPSPGYTVASLPPAKRKLTISEEVTPDFVDQVFKYLSLQFDNVACNFDLELARYTGLTIAVVKADRKHAVQSYCERWVEENPEIITGERSKQGYW